MSSLSFILNPDITIKKQHVPPPKKITISMAHASTIMSCAIHPEIMLDKPQITEKLTNA